MTSRELDRLSSWFGAYADSYLTGAEPDDRVLSMKIEHTFRVRDNMSAIASELSLSGPDVTLAAAAGLLHDVGRFEQYRRHRTFNDLASENHAHLSVRELHRLRVLDGTDKAERRTLLFAVGLHNRRALPPGGTERNRFFLKMLRDADKLDIFRVMLSYLDNRRDHPSSAVDMGLSDAPVCSPPVLESLTKGCMARLEDLATINDYKLMQISWVFDLNFAPSARAAKERGIIEKFAASLPDSPEVRAVVSKAESHLNDFLRYSGSAKLA